MARKKGANSHAKGEGTVYQGRDGKWYAQVTIGFKEDGKPKRKTRTARNKTEAVKLLGQLKLQCQLGQLTIRGDIPFREYASHWQHFKESLSGKTKMDYDSILQNQLLPYFGNLSMNRISLSTVDTFLQEKMRKKYSASSIRKYKAILHNIFERAVAEEVVSKNPVDRSISIPLKKSDRIIISENDLPIIMDAARKVTQNAIKRRQHNGQSFVMYPVLLTALHTGMRIGEILALHWENIDLDGRCIHVTNGLSLEKDINGIHLVRGSTKTLSSIRDIEISDGLCDVLNKMKPYASESNVVFHTKNGTHVAPNNWGREWRKMLDKIGMRGKYRPHEMRHTHVTVLLAEGFSPASIAKRVGHASAQTTLRVYAHAVDGDGRRMAEVFENKVK